MSVQILPLAVTMVAGPQLMAAIIFVTHPTPVRVSAAYVAGFALAAAVGTALLYLLAGTIDLGDRSDRGSAGKIIQYVLVALLLLLAVRTYLHRDTVEPPKWLGGLLEATPRKAFLLGIMLVLLMPTDLAAMLTVGVNLRQNGDSLLGALPFWALTVFFIALPLLAYLLLGRRARETMPKVRDWMSATSWLVNIIVLGIFIVLILS